MKMKAIKKEQVDLKWEKEKEERNEEKGQKIKKQTSPIIYSDLFPRDKKLYKGVSANREAGTPSSTFPILGTAWAL